jgi:hypothetical protein
MYANTGPLLARIVMLMPMFIKSLFLALLFVSGSAFAEWLLITKSPKGETVYIDPATIRKDGDMRTFWRKAEYKDGGKYGDFFSGRSKVEINCKKEEIRMLSLATFSAPNLGGEMTMSEDYPNERFSAIAPGTINNTFMQLVCK